MIAPKHRRDDRSILGRDGIEEGGRAAAAGAGLVLWHDAGTARNEAVKVAGDQPGVGVIAAADVAADDEIDALAGVEILGACDRRVGENGCQKDGYKAEADNGARMIAMHARASPQLPARPVIRSAN
jgi:hypothetical protein